MIPLIGIMIGAYIFTRMIEAILNKETHGAVAICALITIVVVGICVFSLLTISLSDISGLKGLSHIPDQMR